MPQTFDSCYATLGYRSASEIRTHDSTQDRLGCPPPSPLATTVCVCAFCRRAPCFVLQRAAVTSGTLQVSLCNIKNVCHMLLTSAENERHPQSTAGVWLCVVCILAVLGRFRPEPSQLRQQLMNRARKARSSDRPGDSNLTHHAQDKRAISGRGLGWGTHSATGMQACGGIDRSPART